jgi:predicted alpha-1,2-mannosidase
MVALSPDTKHGDLWNAGYRYADKHILSFSHIHNIQLAGIPVMPAVGPCRGHLGLAANQAAFSRETEVVQPGYHRVELTDRGVVVELTATCRVGLSRFTFPDTGEAHLLFDLGAPLGMTTMDSARAERVGATEFVGEVVMSPTYRRKVACPVYFVAQVSRPFDAFAGWRPTKDAARELCALPEGRIAGTNTGVYLTFHNLQRHERVLLKVALSYVSIEQARQNLVAELPGWDFQQTVEAAHRAWNDYLSRIAVRGGTREQREKFYTDLFHTAVGKRIWNDAGGQYMDRGGPTSVPRTIPLDDVSHPRFNLLDMDCLWGSQWNLNLLWLLAYPDVANDVAASFLEYYRHNDILPRGVWGGRDSYVMVGDPTTPLLAALACQDRAKFDLVAAYQAARKNAFPGGVRDRSGYEANARPTGGGMEDYVRCGYVPVEVQQRTAGWHSGGTALTLEYAFQDWCLAHLARLVGENVDRDLFIRRSQNFRNVFDSSSGWMRPRLANGSWMTEFKPVADDDKQSPGFIEGNAAVYTFYVPQDVPGLIDLLGGREKFVCRLEENFRRAADQSFRTPHGGHSRGWVEYGNQPSGSMAHLFSHAGAPWLTQYWVRQVHRDMFSSAQPDGGYHGDEDQGQLGALSALMSIGLFDVQGGVGNAPDWELTAPLFDEVRLNLGNGHSLCIEVHGQRPENVYIQSASFNAKPVRGFAIPSSELLRGGTLKIVVGPRPNKQWGVSP